MTARDIDRDWLGGMKVHPLADRFPMLYPAELAELAADIKANGLLHPIVRTVDGDTLIDGRNRLKACDMAEVAPIFDDRIRDEDEAVALILSANVRRRHMNAGQRAMAHAFAYPEPTAYKRGGSNSFVTKELSLTALSKARTVLAFSEQLAQQVFDDEVKLDAAYETATAAERERQKREAALDRLRGVAPDLVERVEAKDLTYDEARAIFDARDRDARDTRQGVFRLWQELGRATQGVALTPSALDLPGWLDVTEYDTEFRQFFRGGDQELIESLSRIDAARAVVIALVSKLNDRRAKK